MNLSRPSEVKRLLTELDIHPSRALGQNFMTDSNILGILIEAAELTGGERILEVGPGLGVLTEALLERAGEVVAVEKDHRLHAFLERRFAGHKRLRLIRADILDADLPALLAEGIGGVVSNLPYSVASRLIVSLSELEPAPARIVATIQKEVADRLVSSPGSKEYGFLGIIAQLRYTAAVRKIIGSTCFYPPPDVDSALVVLKARPEPAFAVPDDRQAFATFLKTCFSGRRKQLAALLRHGRRSFLLAPDAALQKLGLPAQCRPEAVSPPAWVQLFKILFGDKPDALALLPNRIEKTLLPTLSALPPPDITVN